MTDTSYLQLSFLKPKNIPEASILSIFNGEYYLGFLSIFFPFTLQRNFVVSLFFMLVYYLWRLLSKGFHNTQYAHLIQLRNVQAISLNVFLLFRIILFNISNYTNRLENLKASESEKSD